MKRLTTGLWALCLLGTLWVSCGHDDPLQPITPDPPELWTVEVVGGSVDDEGQVTFASLGAYERLSVRISGYDTARDGAVAVAIQQQADDWLSVAADTLAADGIVLLTTSTNDTGQRRSAALVFTSLADPARTATLSLTQLSASDADHNGVDARSVLYVGYGYDIYAALDNPMSVRTKRPIIDLQDLRANSGVYNFEAVHDARLQRFNVKTYAATTIQELSSTITQSSSASDVSIQGSILTCERLIKSASGIDVNEQNMGYGVMTKTVASRALDRGVLQFFRKVDNETANSNRLGLTLDFQQRLADIRRKSGAERREAATQALLEYGTHLVVQADLGGKIDYTFTVAKHYSYSCNTDVSEEVRYTLGQLTKGDRTTGVTEVSSRKNISGAIQIWGGSAAARRLLYTDIGNLDAKGQLPPEHMQQWLASISYSTAMAADEQLDVVHFELMPVWDLVPDDLRVDFLEATLLLAQRSDCQLPASVLGTDIYEITPQSAAYRSLFDFSRRLTPGTGSLCRLLYFEDQPVLEVCSEYVPKIRTDERVTIVYPIYRQHIRLNQGFFLGDGIHQPAYVGFSGSDCYVNPVDSIAPGRTIDKFYYVNGNLQLKNPSALQGLTGKQRVIQEDFLPLFTDDDAGSKYHRHPLVKIGSKFWTRNDIDHRMLFAETATGSSPDQMEDGVLYAMFQWEPNSEFLGYNGWTWGYAPNTFFEGNPNTKWYLPAPSDVRDLYAFLGFNPKALFKDQLSGWDAQFNGYYGQSDLLNQNRYFPGAQRAMRYKGELNVISSKNTSAYADACIMVIKPDYSMQLIDNSTYRNAWRANWRLNFYPVRPVRGYMFEYPTLTTIRKNQR